MLPVAPVGLGHAKGVVADDGGAADVRINEDLFLDMEVALGHCEIMLENGELPKPREGWRNGATQFGDEGMYVD